MFTIIHQKQTKFLRLYNVAAILLLEHMAPVTLFPMLNVAYFTSVLSALCVQCPVWLFCVFSEHRAFLVCCSGIVLSDSERVPVAPVVTGITVVFKSHKCYTYVLRSLYFIIF